MTDFVMKWIDFCRHWDTLRAMSDKLSESQFYVYHGFDVRTCDKLLAQGEVYSECFRQIILSASAEFEVMCKVLFENKATNKDNIVEISQSILEKYPHITEMEVMTPFHNLKPLVLWKVEKDNSGVNKVKGLDWWFAHNKLKHLNEDEFSEASLDNAIKAVGSLFCIDLYVLQTIMGNLGYADDFPSSYFRFRPYIFNGKEYNKTLPDFKVLEN